MSEQVNPWGRTVTAQRSPGVSKLQPTAHIKPLLKVKCLACGSLMSTVLEDKDADLWIHSTDRLREYRPGDGGEVGTVGDYWSMGEVLPITGMDDFQLSACRRVKSRMCGQAYSWRLAEHRVVLAKARTSGRAQSVRL